MLFVILGVVAGIDNGLGITPPMGWRSWNLYAGDVTQELIESQMRALVKKREFDGKMISLADLGYTNVGLDDAWQKCGKYGPNNSTYHNEDGSPVVNSKFPDMKKMSALAHSLGITSGWYGNNCICSDHVTDEKYYQGDVNAAVGFEFDAIKLDGCGHQKDLTLWAELFNKTGRPVLIENCHWGQTLPNATWCPWNYYRTSGDVRANYGSIVRNLKTTDKLLDQGLSTPGCWAYPDMLEVGVVGTTFHGDVPLTMEETRSHFGGWVIVSSPLILSHDMRNDTIADMIWPLIANPEVIAINQAWHGSSGGCFKEPSETLTLAAVVNETHTDEVEVGEYSYYYKPISDMKTAVLLMNHQNVTVDLTLSISDVPGVGSKASTVRDVWSRKDVASNVDSYTCSGLGAHDACLLMLSHS